MNRPAETDKMIIIITLLHFMNHFESLYFITTK